MLKNLIPFEEFSVQLQILQTVLVEQQSGLCVEPVLQLCLPELSALSGDSRARHPVPVARACA